MEPAREDEMSMVDIVEGPQNEVPTISWRAVLAGGVTAAAVSLLLTAMGVGLGLSSISPWGGEGVSATTFKISTGIYLVAVAMIASTIGGYLAGRLRTKWVGVHDHEIYFRDTAHGLVTWAFASVLSASVLGAATTHILGGATAGLAPAAANAALANPVDVYVDGLLRADPAPGGTATTIAATQPADTGSSRAELGRILAPVVLRKGDISSADRTYVVKVVSARTGLNPTDADARVTDVIARAKKAADDARRSAASLALWLTAALLAGALASMLGATEGGLLRDSKWYEPGWRTLVTRTH
jgi:hypothetical protein